MDTSQIGTLMCCAILIVPGVIGGLSGAWLQRRIDRLGFPGALVPAFIRQILERL